MKLKRHLVRWLKEMNLRGFLCSAVAGLLAIHALAGVGILSERDFFASKELTSSDTFQEKMKIAEIIGNFKTGLDKNKEYKIAETIYYESLKYGHDPLLIVAMILTESSFNNWAISRKGAKGLMQILPPTAAEIAEKANFEWKDDNALHNPFLNIKMGTYYLFSLKLRFKDTALALEAYNAGPTRMRELIRRGRRPYKGYSRKVFSFYRNLKSLETRKSGFRF